MRALRLGGREAIELDAAPGGSPVETGSRKGGRRLALLRGATLLTVLVIAFVALRGMHWGDLGRAIRASDPRWLALAALLNLVVIGLASVRWLSLLRPLAPKSRWRDAFAALLVGYSVSTVVPARGGEVARMAFLHRRTGLSKAQISGTIGLDQLMNASGFFVGLALLPWLGGVPGWMLPGSIVALALFAAAIAAAILVRPIRRRNDRTIEEEPATGWRAILARFRQGLTAVHSPRAMTGSFLASLAAWALEVIVLRLAFRAVGIVLPFSASVVVLMAVNAMIAIPLAPASLGTFEVGAVIGLIGYGIAKEQGLALALLYHALQSVPVAILGLSIAAREGLTGWQTDRV